MPSGNKGKTEKTHLLPKKVGNQSSMGCCKPVINIIQFFWASIATGGNVPSVYYFSYKGTLDVAKSLTNNATLLIFANIIGGFVGVLGTAVALPWTVVNSWRWAGDILKLDRSSLYLLFLSTFVIFSGAFNGVNNKVAYKALFGLGTLNWIGFFLGCCLPGLGNALAIKNNFPGFLDDLDAWYSLFKKCRPNRKEDIKVTQRRTIGDFRRGAALQFSDEKINDILKTKSDSLEVKLDALTKVGGNVKLWKWVAAYVIGPFVSLTFAVISNLNAYGITKDGLFDNVENEGLSFLSVFCAFASSVFQTFLWYMLFQNNIIKPLIRFTSQHQKCLRLIKPIAVSLPALCYGLMNLPITLMDKELTSVWSRALSGTGSIVGNWIIGVSGLCDLITLIGIGFNPKTCGFTWEKGKKEPLEKFRIFTNQLESDIKEERNDLLNTEMENMASSINLVKPESDEDGDESGDEFPTSGNLLFN